MRTLLIGAGQIGRSVAAALAEPPTLVGVPWDRPAEARSAIEGAVERFFSRGDAGPWAVCWSAGKGVVGTPQADFDVELGHLRAALDAVAASPGHLRADGRLVLASSAGGIHAGGGPGAVSEESPPTPVSDYGRAKLRAEELVAGFARATGVPCLLGRISNVYGPDQDLRKAQGFISHLCRAMIRRDAFVLSVPPDTIRDFVYGPDVGRRVAGWLGADRRDQTGTAVVKLLVSGRSTTLHEVIGVVRSVARVPARITTSPLSPPDQPGRTRFRSTALAHLDRAAPTTPLAEGVHHTWQHLLRRSAAGQPAG